MYFYFSLIPYFNYARVKKKQMIYIVNKQIHKLISEKKIYKARKDYKHTYCLKKNQPLS